MSELFVYCFNIFVQPSVGATREVDESTESDFNTMKLLA